MKYRIELTLEYDGPDHGHRPQVIKDWLHRKLHRTRLEQGGLTVVSMRTVDDSLHFEGDI